MSKHWYEDHAFIGDLYFKIKGVRLDAGETAGFSRVLTYIAKKTYDKKYPDNKARQFLPVNYEVPEGAEFWAERGYDWAGMFKIISDYAADLPIVSVLATEVIRKVVTTGGGYQYSIIDIAKAAMSGINLVDKEAFATKRASENTIEQLAAVGNANANVPGFLTNANVTLLTAAGGDITGDWANSTSDQILADLNIIGNKVFDATLGTYDIDTLLLPPAKYSLVMSKPFSDLNPKPVGRLFLEASTHIQNIDWWSFLATADAAGTGPRAVAYKRDSEVVELFIMKEFTQLPPVAKALAIKIDCYNRVGGVAWHQPLGGLYIDGI